MHPHTIQNTTVDNIHAMTLYYLDRSLTIKLLLLVKSASSIFIVCKQEHFNSIVFHVCLSNNFITDCVITLKLCFYLTKQTAFNNIDELITP